MGVTLLFTVIQKTFCKLSPVQNAWLDIVCNTFNKVITQYGSSQSLGATCLEVQEGCTHIYQGQYQLQKAYTCHNFCHM